MKYYLLQLGCQMNISDGERIRTVLQRMGLQPTEDERQAELLGVVACSVRQRAIDKVYGRITKWNRWKQERSLLTFASGCILPADHQKLLRQFDFIFPIEKIAELPTMIQQYGVATPLAAQLEGIHPAADNAVTVQHPLHPERSATVNPATDYWRVMPTYGSPFEAFVPIQNGCDKFCTFCAVPYTRGREVSRESDSILEEVTQLVDQGYKTITLLGQNVNSYGLDRKGAERSFPELMREIGELIARRKQRCWVYFTSPHPRDMSLELLETIATYPALAKQIHLPLQSGDDKVLIRMNRNHSVQRYRQLVATIRQILPSATLFTDIIVGFSGETKEQFANTQRALAEFRYNMAYIAIYSPRPGAASARWRDDVPHDIKRQRLQVLTQELMRSAFAYNSAQIGQTIPVLVTAPDRKEGYLSAKSEGKITVRFQGERALIGSWQEITINAVQGLSMEGRRVEVSSPPAEPAYQLSDSVATR